MLIRRKKKYVIKEAVSVLNTSAPLHIGLSFEAHITEKQFYSEEQTKDIASSLMYLAGTRCPTVFKKR